MSRKGAERIGISWGRFSLLILTLRYELRRVIEELFLRDALAFRMQLYLTESSTILHT